MRDATLRRLLASSLPLLALLLAFACGGDDDTEPTTAPGASTGGTLGGPETFLAAPAARYVPGLNELAGDFTIYPPDTYEFTLQLYSAVGPFASSAEGEELGGQWGYKDGYQASYHPEGLLAGVLQGRYFVSVESHLFGTVDGARRAFDTYAARYAAAPDSEPQQPKGLANQSVSFKLIRGKVGTSEMDTAYHRFIFRRGNMVAVVQTVGGAPFMTIDRAREIAVIIDERALGKRVATEPTPIKGQGLAPTPARGN